MDTTTGAERPREQVIQTLVPLGFTPLEGEVYAILVAESPATGYRVAQAIGKPVANTYKAIESLERKGAIVVDDGESRLCRAVPPRELLAQLTRRFQERRRHALRALSQRPVETGDDRVYQVRSAEQVFERCRSMLRECRQVALIDVFPRPLAELRPDIERCAARGRTVGLKVYEPTDIEGVEGFLPPDAAATLARWPGQWLNLVVDGAGHLLAFLSPNGDGVYQAVWSQSAYLSWVYHCALAAELFAAGVAGLLRETTSVDGMRALLSDHQRFFAVDAPGYRSLIARFSRGQPSEARDSIGRDSSSRNAPRASAKGAQRTNQKHQKGTAPC